MNVFVKFHMSIYKRKFILFLSLKNFDIKNFDILALLANDIINIIENRCNISIPKITGDLLISDCNKKLCESDEIDKFFANLKFTNYVLLSNGNSRSGQTENFNVYEWLEPVIQMYPDWGFIFTE